MKSTGLISLLQKHALRVFTTADLITLTGLAPSAATQALSRLEADGILVRIKKGVWVNRLATDLNPYEAVPHLRSPWPAYVSLYSALSDHGLVAEIPHLVYAVSAGRAGVYRTQVADFRIHHLPSRLMWGYEMKPAGRGLYPMADPEKAFLDTIYLAKIPRSPIRLPQRREAHWALDRARLRQYSRRFAFPPLTRWLKEQSLL